MNERVDGYSQQLLSTTFIEKIPANILADVVSRVIKDKRFELLIKAQDEQRDRVVAFFIMSLSESYGDSLLSLSYAVREHIKAQDIISSSPKSLQ